MSRPASTFPGVLTHSDLAAAVAALDRARLFAGRTQGTEAWEVYTVINGANAFAVKVKALLTQSVVEVEAQS